MTENMWFDESEEMYGCFEGWLKRVAPRPPAKPEPEKCEQSILMICGNEYGKTMEQVAAIVENLGRSGTIKVQASTAMRDIERLRDERDALKKDLYNHETWLMGALAELEKLRPLKEENEYIRETNDHFMKQQYDLDRENKRLKAENERLKEGKEDE